MEWEGQPPVDDKLDEPDDKRKRRRGPRTPSATAQGPAPVTRPMAPKPSSMASRAAEAPVAYVAIDEELAALESEFVALDVPMEAARWINPGQEGNQLGYYRVLKSTLRYEKPDGTAGTVAITSMISWRGEWYVVHLTGFR